MPVGVSFCPACANPTQWCSHDERVEWEVLQYRQLREKPVGVQPQAAPLPARRTRTVAQQAAPQPLGRTRAPAAAKEPVTVEIKPRFGKAAASAAEATKRPRSRPAAERSTKAKETPSAPEQPRAATPAADAPVRARKPRETKPAAAPRRRTDEPARPAARQTSKGDVTPEAARARPAAASRAGDIDLTVSQGPEKRQTVQQQMREILALLERIDGRLSSLEQRMNGAHPESAPTQAQQQRWAKRLRELFTA